MTPPWRRRVALFSHRLRADWRKFAQMMNPQRWSLGHLNSQFQFATNGFYVVSQGR
ncbi:protein of unknown function [Shinella sp. WSC3-e]|nr:hypothetical protein SHINE37_41370 [Rhizobiaceae bacterium]CAK7256002.1 protein of unknown function [Shinella sp. WSC3-e]